jgi:D-aspartate ligase
MALVSRSNTGMAHHSRFAVRHLVMPDRKYDPGAIATQLGVQRPKPVLFLTEELDVVDCLAQPASWTESFTTSFYTPDVALDLMTKSGFDGLARAVGAPVPKTMTVNGVERPSAIESLEFPIIVKPVARDERYSGRFEKAYLIRNYRELDQLLSAAVDLAIPLVLQEWIPGQDSDIYFNFVFLDGDGELCNSFVGQKILCWPPQVGGTASCVAAPKFHDELTSITLKFAHDIGFRGLLGMEYKRDERNGRFLMIEPTVYRTDYQHEISALSGADLLFSAYKACLGTHRSVASRYERQRYWVDFPAARHSASMNGSAIEQVAGLRRADAYFRLSDPLPGVVYYGRYIRKKFENAFRYGRRNVEVEKQGAGND